MQINIKLLEDTAKIPTKAHDTDAGFDLYVSRCGYENNLWVCHSDVAFEIPKGYVGFVFPRSSISNTSLTLSNSVGVIDSGYRGEIIAKFHEQGRFGKTYQVGERFAQLIIMPYPEIEFNCVTSLNDSDRGSGGYGSSGL